jgi:DNA-binding response OmpR family regulator
MIDGLIISHDKSLFDELNINFSSILSIFEYADSVEAAKEHVNTESFDYVLVITRNLSTAVEIVNQLREESAFDDIPLVCCSAGNDQNARITLWELGVKDVIRLPILKEEMKLRMERFFRAISNSEVEEQTVGMQGKLEDYNLIDIVQTLEQNKKTGMLIMYHGRDEGRIWFREGEIYDARFRNVDNISAIMKLMTWMEGDFTMTFTGETYERKIEVDNQQILLDAIQYLDERNQIMQTLPDQDEVLLISPETDLTTMNAEDATYLRFFHGGQTIATYLTSFDDDEISLLKRVSTFVEKDHLMTREQFDNYTTVTEREIGQAGIKKVFNKLFKSRELSGNGRKTKKTGSTKTRSSMKKDETTELDIHMPQYFQKNEQELRSFMDKIDSLT